jgi:hypothetical protein
MAAQLVQVRGALVSLCSTTDIVCHCTSSSSSSGISTCFMPALDLSGRVWVGRGVVRQDAG